MLLYCALISAALSSFTEIDFGDSNPHQIYNDTSNDIIQDGNGDAWSEGMDDAIEGGTEDSTEGLSQDGEQVDDFSDSPNGVPETLIYVCGGTAEPLGFCQFPFTTLAGNSYTHSCADKVEDNPDYAVDRPWCFTTATEWGFCDCTTQIWLSYVSLQNGQNSTMRDIQVQVDMEYPGTIWCSLAATPNDLPSLHTIVNNTEANRYAGGFSILRRDMILRSVKAQIVFTTTPAYMKSHPYLACQARVPGILTPPEPSILKLGANTATPIDDNTDTEVEPPKILTETSGALMYSVVIFMILGGFIGYRYAMDKRAELLAFARIAQEDSILLGKPPLKRE